MLFVVWRARLACAGVALLVLAEYAAGHGSAISPESRVHRVYASNPENPSFQLARNAIATDGTNSYYTWTELSRNIPQAVTAGLPAGFDYSPWVPDGQLASGGRVAIGPGIPRTYAGLDQVSAALPTHSNAWLPAKVVSASMPETSILSVRWTKSVITSRLAVPTPLALARL